MAALAADHARPVIRAFGGTVFAGGDAARAFPGSHDGFGCRFHFRPKDSAWVHALDVEFRRPLPELLAARLEGGLLDWVRMEVLAKLSGQPAHLLLRRRQAGLPLPVVEGMELVTHVTPTHLLAIGRRPAMPGAVTPRAALRIGPDPRGRVPGQACQGRLTRA